MSDQKHEHVIIFHSGLFIKIKAFRDVENKVDADESTLFGIGSTSKAMTSIVVNKVQCQ